MERKNKGREGGGQNGRRREGKQKDGNGKNSTKLYGWSINLSSSMLLLLSHDLSEKKNPLCFDIHVSSPWLLGKSDLSQDTASPLTLPALTASGYRDILSAPPASGHRDLCLLIRFSEFEAQILYLRIISGHYLHAHTYKFWCISKGQRL